MAASKYRLPALEAAIAVERHDDHLEVLDPRTWIAGLAVVGLLSAALAASAIIDVPVNVETRGIIVAPGGVIDIVSDTQGILGDLQVKVGDTVTPGMALAVVEQPDVRLELAAAEAKLHDDQAFLTRIRGDQARETGALDEFRTRRDAALTENVELLQKHRDSISERLGVLRDLSSRQIVAQDRVLAANAEFIMVEAQIAQAERERNQLALDDATRRIQRERDELEASRRVAEASRATDAIRQRLERLGVVRANYGGRVIELKTDGGEAVQRGTAIMVVERQDVAASRLPVTIAYFSAEDGKKIEVGQPVEVSPVNVERGENGFIRGRVVQISDAPASTQGMLRVLHNDQLVSNFTAQMSAPFEALIALDTRADAPGELDWSSDRKPDKAVEPGTLATVSVTVKKVRLISLILPTVRRLFGLDLLEGAYASQ